MQGDVTEIYDINGNAVVRYFYDAWGNCTYTGDTTIAKANPIRYRGYYYDEETGLYYLNARYYNPKWRRFISPDSTSYLDPKTANGLNLYAYCNNDPLMCSLEYNTRRSISSSTFTLGQSYASIGSYDSDKSPIKSNISIIGSSARPITNIVSMTNYSTTLVDNVLIGMALGNISHTITTQHNDSGVFYAYSNIGNSTSSVGVGLNIKDWYESNVYVSSNIGIGSSMQFGSITYGAEISILDGISLSFGTVSGKVTNETTVSIGWGTLAFAYATCAVIAATPVPGARVLAGAAAGVILIIDIFN